MMIRIMRLRKGGDDEEEEEDDVVDDDDDDVSRLQKDVTSAACSSLTWCVLVAEKKTKGNVTYQQPLK